MIPIIKNSSSFGERIAIIDYRGEYTYSTLYATATEIARNITALNIQSKPILFLIPSGFHYVALQWAIWLSGKIAVPVHTAHPPAEIDYLLSDTGSGLLIYEESFLEKINNITSKDHVNLPLTALLKSKAAD